MTMTHEATEIPEKCITLARERRKVGLSYDFTHREVPELLYNWQMLRRLINEGMIKVVLVSNKNQYLKLAFDDLDALEHSIEVGKMIETLEPLEQEAEVPDDLFDIIKGYDDIKAEIKQTLGTPGYNFIFYGDPASAKTLFLLELSRVPGSKFCIGMLLTKAGIIDSIFANPPRILLIDELDKARPEDQNALLPFDEWGIVAETKYKRERAGQFNIQVFAAANTPASISSQLRSRFFELHFPRYSKSDFMDISKHVLGKWFSLPDELGRYIGEKAWEIGGDIRDAVRIGKVAQDEARVDAIIDLLQKYRR